MSVEALQPHLFDGIMVGRTGVYAYAGQQRWHVDALQVIGHVH
jgi:hypothetical protein